MLAAVLEDLEQADDLQHELVAIWSRPHGRASTSSGISAMIASAGHSFRSTHTRCAPSRSSVDSIPPNSPPRRARSRSGGIVITWIVFTFVASGRFEHLMESAGNLTHRHVPGRWVRSRSLTSREGRDGRPARSAVDDSEGVEVREVVTVRRTLERNQGSRIDYRRVRDPPHSGAARPQENNPAAVAARNRTLHAQAVGQRLDSGTGGPNTERSASRGKLVDGPGPYRCEGSDTDVVARVRDAVSRPVVECNARPRGTTLRVTQSWLARPCPHPFVTACEGRSPQAPAPRRRGRSEP